MQLPYIITWTFQEPCMWLDPIEGGLKMGKQCNRADGGGNLQDHVRKDIMPWVVIATE